MESDLTIPSKYLGIATPRIDAYALHFGFTLEV